jgi:hypothetical protein
MVTKKSKKKAKALNLEAYVINKEKDKAPGSVVREESPSPSPVVSDTERDGGADGVDNDDEDDSDEDTGKRGDIKISHSCSANNLCVFMTVALLSLSLSFSLSLPSSQTMSLHLPVLFQAPNQT